MNVCDDQQILLLVSFITDVYNKMSFWARGRHVVSNFIVVNMLKLLLCFGDFVQIGEKINFSFSAFYYN